jgi:putative ABC transport system substrate-binding protein
MRLIGLAVALSVGFAITALTAEGQQQAGKMYRIGWLASGSSSGSADVDLSRAFRETLRQLGYTEGRNLLFDQRFAEGRSDSLQNSAAQLVGLKVDALLALGTPATLAAMQATKSIPIVMISVGDPVGSGLVSSLGKPGEGCRPRNFPHWLPREC